MSRSRLFLTGIRARGRHGATPAEKDEPQEFVIDLDVEVEVGADAIDETGDYRSVVDAARAAVEETSFDLLETLADAVARAAIGVPGVLSARAVVHKPAAADSLGIQGVAAAATAEPSGA